MNAPKVIEVELLSDTTFSRGEGTAGVVDIEVQHDELGLPYVGGKTLHGLLRDSWFSMRQCFPELREASQRILGPPCDVYESSVLHIGNAVMEDGVRKWIEAAEHREHHRLPPAAILEALTDVRRQTSEDRETGTPAETTLRSSRVILRETKLRASLLWLSQPTEADVQCLALCALATRHAGLSRNRGRGHIRITVDGDLGLTRSLATGGQP